LLTRVLSYLVNEDNSKFANECFGRVIHFSINNGKRRLTVSNNHQTLVLGGGCFWCLEAVFQSCKGVVSVTSGYTDGNTDNPSYSEICTGTTGHAEVILIEFNPNIISINELLQVFFVIHDPTTLNRQGNDQGTQYRSIICYTNEQEKQTIKDFIKRLQADSDSAIVTQIKKLSQFYKAEAEHQNYYKQNSSQAYCQMVIKPKLNKLSQLKHLLSD